MGRITQHEDFLVRKAVALAKKKIKGGGTTIVQQGGGGAYVHPNHSGDVTSVGDGAQTIVADAVTNTQLANMATDTIKGRATAATGDPEDLTALPFAFTGDVTRLADSNVQTIPNDTVTNAKLADVATQTFKGRTTTGTGDPEDLTATQARTVLNVADGANNYVHPNHSGDVTSVGDGAQTIANNAVTNAKAADMATDTIKGRATAATGDPEDLTALPFAFTGDVTRPADSNAQTIPNDTVDNARLANMATQTFKGRTTAGTGDPEDLTVAQAKTMLNVVDDSLVVHIAGTETITGAKTIANDDFSQVTGGAPVLAVETTDASGAAMVRTKIGSKVTDLRQDGVTGGMVGTAGASNPFSIHTNGVARIAISDTEIDANVQLDMTSHKIVNVTDPTSNQDAATKKYVDDNAGGSGTVESVNGADPSTLVTEAGGIRVANQAGPDVLLSSAFTRYSPTLADADNTTSEITLLQFTVKANSFLDSQVIRSTYISKFKQNKGTSGTVTYKLYWGSNSVTIQSAVNVANNAGEEQAEHGFKVRRTGTSIFLSDNNAALTGVTGAFGSASTAEHSDTDGFLNKTLTSQAFTADTIVKLTLTMSDADVNFYEHMITAEAFKW